MADCITVSVESAEPRSLRLLLRTALRHCLKAHLEAKCRALKKAGWVSFALSSNAVAASTNAAAGDARVQRRKGPKSSHDDDCARGRAW